MPRPSTSIASASATGTSGKACLAILATLGAIGLGIGTFLFVVFGMDSHHDGPDSIGWPEQDRVYIPATATDITLSRTFFDHWARYQVSTADLHAMLATRFPSDFDPAKDAEGSPVNHESFEENYRKYDWTWSSGLVRHSCIAPNGGTHTFWHDPTTGQTYQASVGW